MTDALWLSGWYGALSALALVAVRSLELLPDAMTPFELRRRLAAGEVSAGEHELRRLRLPRVLALRRIAELVLVASLAASIITRYGWLAGAVVIFLFLLLVDMLAEWPPLRRFANRLYRRYENTMLRLVDGWSWLDMLRVPLTLSGDVTVNSKAELVDLVKRSGGVLTNDEQTHVLKTLSFDEIAVGSIMTPRSMIDSIDQSEVIGPLVLDQLHKSGHSRIPVIDSDIDHIVGMLYIRDLVTIDKTTQYHTVKDAMRPEVYYIHEDHHLEHALHAFLRTHHHLCIVVNEFRETVGLLTLEDVIEALLGRHIVDEFDEFADLRKVAASNPRANNQPKGKKDL